MKILGMYMVSVMSAFVSMVAFLGWEKFPEFMILAGIVFGGLSLFVLVNTILMHIEDKRVVTPDEKEAIDFIEAVENNKEQLKKIFKEKAENDNLAQVQGFKDFDSAPKGSK